MKKSIDYEALIDSFRSLKILVLGDLMLDIYVTGTTRRLSPEAPVPVVDVIHKKITLGGAANVACNLKSLGAKVKFVSVTGDDDAAMTAMRMLDELNIEKEIFRDKSRATLTKTRIVSGTQTITRVDEGSTHQISEQARQLVLSALREELSDSDALFISDYDKGILSKSIVEEIAAFTKTHRIMVCVDSKQLELYHGLNPDVVKPNYEEALRLLAIADAESNRLSQLSQLGAKLQEKTNAKIIALTLDSDGSVVLRNGIPVTYQPAIKKQSAFVSGAGDTFLSAFVLTYLTHGDLTVCNKLASLAAAITINQSHTASCSSRELLEQIQGSSKVVRSRATLAELCKNYRREGKTIAFTNGCFDILHSGHVTCLEAAQKYADVLIVAVNDDESIARLKGKSRPINSLDDRIQVLSSLSAVTHIVPFGTGDNDLPIGLLHIIRPHFYIKGGDYAIETLRETDIVKSYGGQVIIVPTIPEHSTSLIIKKIGATKRTFDERVA